MHVPSLKSLKTFQVAARLRSIKAAAEELCVTPSAVAYQIKSLHDQLGVPLFEEGERSLRLTLAGADYLRHVNEILAHLESVTERLQAGCGRSIIRVNAPLFFASEMLLPRLGKFPRSRKETDIRVETKIPVPRTHGPEADLSIVVGTGPWDGLIAHSLFAQSFIAACSPRFLIENRIDKYTDLNGKTLLLHEHRRDVWERWAMGLKIAPLHPHRVVCLDTMSEVVRAAEQGIGAALVPTRLSADRFAARGLVRLFPAELATDESYVLLHRPEDRTRADVQELTRWILSECRAA